MWYRGNHLQHGPSVRERDNTQHVEFTKLAIMEILLPESLVKEIEEYLLNPDNVKGYRLKVYINGERGADDKHRIKR